MPADEPQPSTRGLVRELLRCGSITIVTTCDRAPLAEGSAIEAVTIIQLDGDVVTRIRNGAPIDDHLKQVHATVGRLRAEVSKFKSFSLVAFLIICLAVWLPWLPSTVVRARAQPGGLVQLFGDAATWMLASVGVSVPGLLWLAWRRSPRLLWIGLRWWACRASHEVLSGRVRPAG